MHLFMHWLETTRLLKNWKGTKPLLWRRFIDDIFFVWVGREDELKDFINHLNSQHRLIKFTANYDFETRSTPFLDMEVYIDSQGFIQTDLYRKECARVQYLLPESCHPGHITKNIPYSLAYRLLRICSKQESFMRRLQELKQDLISRGYRVRIIDDAFNRVMKVTREEALKRVEAKENTREVLSVTFHPGLPSVSNILKKHHGVMIAEDPEMQDIFTAPSLVCYRRSKNLKEYLVKAKVPNKRQTRKRAIGLKPCRVKGGCCIMCFYCPTTKTHKCFQTGESWDIRNSIDCETVNVIYKLICQKCPSWVYVGETQRKAKARFYEHRSYVENQVLSTPTGRHFNMKGHSVSDLRMIPFERVRPANNPFTRKVREKYWINKYRAIKFGENTKKSS